MLKINLVFTTIAFLVAAVIIPKSTSSNTATIEWKTQPETTYLNVWSVYPDNLVWVGSTTGGITQTLTLSGFAGTVFVVNEYRLVDNVRLVQVTSFATEPVPHVDFPTATPTPMQTATPVQTQTQTQTPIPTLPSKPTATVTPIQIKPQIYNPIVIW